VSIFRFFGIILLSVSLHAQISAAAPRATAGPFSTTLMTASGEVPLGGDFQPFTSNPTTPARPVVSIRELQNPIPKKARREAYQAQQFSRANQLAKAIAKLEQAIRIAPRYRDAHVNLGVQYARVGRPGDARSEFQKALDVGPPMAVIYSNLAFAYLDLNQAQQAEAAARKALELEPTDSVAQSALELAKRTAMNLAAVK
jgi:tetratricopeptide (TPR) repeat protein